MSRKKKFKNMLYLIVYIILYIFSLFLILSFLVKQISQNKILFEWSYNFYFNDTFLSINKNNIAKNIKHCFLVDTNTFIYKQQLIKYIDIYKYKPKYIYLCPDMKKQSITNGLGMIILIMNNFYKNYNKYNINHLYHELVHYNFLITLFNNPLRYWELKTQALKIYKKLNNFCKIYKNQKFGRYNITTYSAINLECSNIRFIKKNYTKDDDYGKAEELIAYQTLFKKVNKDGKLRYSFDIKNIENKEIKNILIDMKKIYKEYILK